MSEIITSPANPRIKFVRKLHDRKTRDENKIFYVEGIRIVGEAFSCNWVIKEVFYSPELIEDGFASQLVEKLTQNNIKIIKIDKNVFKTISVKDGPKGLSAIVEQKIFPLSKVIEGGIWVALDRIQDPGNLGTILRTVDAVGGKGIILIDNCTDPFDLSAVRSSMGALFSLNIIKTKSSEFVKFIKEKGIITIGTSDSGNLDYRLQAYVKNMILLMGSEREGLTEELKSICSNLVKIPMAGKSDSLNLAIATGVCLYEIHNQNNPIK